MNQKQQNLICGPNFKGWISKDAVGSSGGMLSCWNINEFDGSLIAKGGYSLTIKLNCKASEFSWMLSNIDLTTSRIVGFYFMNSATLEDLIVTLGF